MSNNRFVNWLLFLVLITFWVKAFAGPSRVIGVIDALTVTALVAIAYMRGEA